MYIDTRAMLFACAAPEGGGNSKSRHSKSETMKFHLATMIFGAALLLAAGSGCVLWQNEVIETAEFDPVWGERGEKAPVPLVYGVFGNFSGSGRRFLIREEGGRVSAEEYVRWIDSPERLLERAFYRWLPMVAAPESDDAPTTWCVSCVLTRFDFEGGTAVLAADFDIRRGSEVKNLSVEHRVPVKKRNAPAMAAAMGTAMRECVAEVRRAITPAAKVAK